MRFRKVSVREDAFISYIAPGVAWVILGMVNILHIEWRPLTELAAVLLMIVVVLMISALVRHIEKGDEQTLATSGIAARMTVKLTLIGMMVISLVSLVYKDLSAAGAIELGLAVLCLSYGVAFLCLMGREDAYLDD